MAAAALVTPGSSPRFAICSAMDDSLQVAKLTTIMWFTESWYTNWKSAIGTERLEESSVMSINGVVDAVTLKEMVQAGTVVCGGGAGVELGLVVVNLPLEVPVPVT